MSVFDTLQPWPLMAYTPTDFDPRVAKGVLIAVDLFTDEERALLWKAEAKCAWSEMNESQRN